MAEATPSARSGDARVVDDPTLASLVPAPSTRRNVVLLVAAMTLLAGAWFSAQALRPSIVPMSTVGGAGPGDPGHVLTFMRVETHGWPWVVVDGVEGVAGAEVTHAWLVPEGDDAVLLPPGDTGPLDTLPQRVAPDRTLMLAVQWVVTDCRGLDQLARPVVTLRSALGTTSHEDLPLWMSPASDPTTLTDLGLCPAP